MMSALSRSRCRVWPGRRHVSIVLYAESTDPTDSRHTLIEADEATIHAPARTAGAILRAPGVILGFGGIAGGDCSGDKTNREQR
jgi:hypothetical protein